MINFFKKPTFLIILGIIIGLGGFFLILANPFGWPTIQPKLTITNNNKSKRAPGYTTAPTPVLILPSGKQTYNVQGGETDISSIRSVTIDPLDVKKDQNQSISVKATSKEPISTFTVSLVTDSKSIEIPLKLANGNESSGTWTSKYPVTDTTNKTYTFVFNIITVNGNKTVTPFLLR